MPKKRMPARLLVVAATLGALLSLTALFSQHHQLFDIISHFRVQYIVLLIPGIIVAIAIKRLISIVILFTALAVHLYAVTLSWLPEPMQSNLAGSEDFTQITVLNSNLLLVNTEYDAQVEYIRLINPDIIAFQEYTHAWDEQLSRRLTDYPYSITSPTHGVFGIALFSKYPIVDGGVEKLSPATTETIDARIALENREIRVIAVHPSPPASEEMYESRNELMMLIAERSAVHEGAMIVMGDFNSTPWTAHFSNMLTKGNLRNASAGSGIYPSWPTGLKGIPFLIPIDHVLINPRVSAMHFETKEVPGSDHRNIWSRLKVY